MARTSLAQIRSLPDPLASWNFDLIITGLPVGDTQALTLKCRTSMLPGLSAEDVTVQLHGHDLKYLGRPMWEHTLQVTYLETRDLTTRDTIRSWIEFARNARNNTGAYKADYEAVGDLVLYDDRANAIRTIRHYGFYPQLMDSPTLDGGNSAPVEFNITFFYDFHVDL